MQKQEVLEIVKKLGAHQAALIEVSKIPFNKEFRKACEVNSCGNYGKSWMCPPDIGEIDDLIQQAQGYQWAVVYQTVGQLIDSYDFEGMMEAGKKHNELAQRVTDQLELGTMLHLGAGGCRVCERCAKADDQPCRFPDRAMGSLEAYGMAVSELAALCGMNYINGQDTVTYFGAVLFDEPSMKRNEK